MILKTSSGTSSLISRSIHSVKNRFLGVIPAAGSGVRARPYTYEVHKGMFAIDGSPNIERIIVMMRDELGIEEIVIVLGYMGDVIRDYFQNGEKYGVRINYVDNKHLDKGWAWSVLLAKQYLAGRLAYVMLSDEFYLDTNLGDLQGFPFDSYTAVCNVKGGVEPELIMKNFSVEKDGQRVIRLVENPRVVPNDLLGMATFVVNDEFFQLLEAAYDSGRPTIDFVNFIDELIKDGHKVAAFDFAGQYINLNDVVSLELAQDMAIRKRIESA